MDGFQESALTCHPKEGERDDHAKLRFPKYRGINTLVLWASALENGYETQEWATYKQWSERGAQVRKGEKATAIAF